MSLMHSASVELCAVLRTCIPRVGWQPHGFPSMQIGDCSNVACWCRACLMSPSVKTHLNSAVRVFKTLEIFKLLILLGELGWI